MKHCTPQDLFDSAAPMVFAVVNRSRRKWQQWIEEDDALQFARMGIWNAAQHFDQSRGVKFSTYAFLAAVRQIELGVKVAKRRGFRFPPPDAAPAVHQFGEFEPAGNSQDATTITIKREEDARLKAIVDDVLATSRVHGGDHKTPEILWRMANGEKLREIAPSFGLSYERIRQIANAGKRRAATALGPMYREAVQ